METTIEIPEELRRKIEQAATAQGISPEDFVREVLEWALSHDIDPLFADEAVYTEDAPDDLSVEHDRYLYGEQS